MKNDDINTVELYCEEVQEIMGKPPSKIARYGIAVFLIVLFTIVFISFFIKFPDTIDSPVVIISDNPPVFVRSSASARIDSVLVSNNIMVKENNVLAILHNPAKYEDVLKLKEYLHTLDTVILNGNINLNKIPLILNVYNLGFLQTSFLKFRREILNVKYQARINNINDYRSNIALIEEGVDKIKTDIAAWEKENLLVSPLNGRLLFTKKWKKESGILPEEVVFIVNPVEQQLVRGIITIPENNLRKLRIGQKTIIKLRDYPNNEYGTIEGKVQSINLFPAKDTARSYTAIIELSKGLKTSTGEELTYIPNMQGEAEIIIRKISIAQKLFSPLNFLSINYNN